MANESGLRHAILDRIRALHGVAIESPLEPGTPDVNCSVGWIELKHLEDWPVREGTIVVPRHFKPEQRAWLRHRCQAGGKAWLLLRVGHHWSLIWGVAAAEHLGVHWTRSDLSTPSTHILPWATPPSSADLIRALVLRPW